MNSDSALDGIGTIANYDSICVNLHFGNLSINKQSIIYTV
jgi:hypothetical protein